MRRIPTLLLFFLLFLPTIATAQQSAAGSMAPGTRVRILAEGRSAIGGIHSIQRDSLALTLWEQPGSWTVPLASVQRLEVSTGRESRLNSAMRWAWRSGLAFTAFVGLTLVPFCGEEECGDLPIFLMQMASSGAMMGGVYGAFAPAERWVGMPLTELTGASLRR